VDLKSRLNTDMKEALKAGDRIRLSTIRLVLSEIKNAEIEKRGELTEDELLGVLSKEARKRREAIEEFERGGRKDLVFKESEELKILKGYMPRQLSDEEIRKVIREAIEETGASSPRDLGKVMGVVMPKVRGKVDGKVVNRIAAELLEG